ncbi:hypothetical protein DPMN_103422 [Dreissena polymorpha]|uniref:Uncharacterized protein n=1 Tax=Dreissena polymorpha TaxID=45954 RepID=A0A9D4H7U8_DREPO|nr:hypothetical protein DPMN_103422 [Dreissena polymorpha]
MKSEEVKRWLDSIPNDDEKGVNNSDQPDTASENCRSGFVLFSRRQDTNMTDNGEPNSTYTRCKARDAKMISAISAVIQALHIVPKVGHLTLTESMKLFLQEAVTRRCKVKTTSATDSMVDKLETEKGETVIGKTINNCEQKTNKGDQKHQTMDDSGIDQEARVLYKRTRKITFTKTLARGIRKQENRCEKAGTMHPQAPVLKGLVVDNVRNRKPSVVRASRSANIREEFALKQRVEGFRSACSTNISKINYERRRLNLLFIMGLNTVYVLIAFWLCVRYYQCAFTPSNLYHCNTNEHCNNTQLCCSYTPALGKRSAQGRQVPPDWDGMVHYCLPWKGIDAMWCELGQQYSPDTEYYNGLCPCGPGLKCTPTHELDPRYYPRDRFGKCTSV